MTLTFNPSTTVVPTEAELRRSIQRSGYLGVPEEVVQELLGRMDRYCAARDDAPVRRVQLVRAIERQYVRAVRVRDPRWRAARALHELWVLFRRWHVLRSGLGPLRHRVLRFPIMGVQCRCEVAVERLRPGVVRVHLLGGSIGAEGPTRRMALANFRSAVESFLGAAQTLRGEGMHLSRADATNWDLLRVRSEALPGEAS